MTLRLKPGRLVRDADPDVGFGDEQPLLGQMQQRVADRTAADAKLHRQRLLPQRSAGQQLSGKDAAAQMGRDLFLEVGGKLHECEEGKAGRQRWQLRLRVKHC
jgi:hypothetical protein